MLNPWAEISEDTFSQAVNARRINPTHPVDLFWVKDTSGNYCFLADNLPLSANVKLPQLLGIELMLVQGGVVGPLRIILRLKDNQWWQVFYTLCSDIVDATITESPRDFLRVFLARLLKWQSMLKLLDEKRMSQSEIQGLWGELIFLYRHLSKKFSWSSAVNSWKGPWGHPQDYSVEGDVIEIKTLQNSSRREVMISSLNQLDHVGGRIFLHLIVVGMSEDSYADALTLNELVSRIRQSIDLDIETRDAFDAAVSKAGYVYDPAYDLARYLVVEENTYEVREGFPRICGSRLPVGVLSGSYSISADNLDRFLNAPKWMEDEHELA